MSQERSGGSVDGQHVSTHTRTKSTENEPLSGASGVETRAPGSPTQGPGSIPNHRREPRRLSTASHDPGVTHSAAAAPTRVTSSSETPDVQPQPLEVPVNKAALSELDAEKFIYNPKLRHDINYDPQLHFRPNADGERGRKKQEKADQFWDTLERQLVEFVSDSAGFKNKYSRNGDWCLPQLLKAVKEIVHMLVPDEDRHCVNDGLDVDLLMQEFYQGAMDMEKLASWLASLLKRHCAPMRDAWVEQMERELVSGSSGHDIAMVVQGLRSLLALLETMKLDVANHQIRCLRPALIEDTVHFERSYFIRRMEQGKIDVQAAEDWFREAREIATRQSRRLALALPLSDETVFFYALCRMVMPSLPVQIGTSNICPETLLFFDEDRIIKLRSEMYDFVCLRICLRQYEVLRGMSRLLQLPGMMSPIIDESQALDSASDEDSGSDACETTYTSYRSGNRSSIFASRCSLHQSGLANRARSSSDSDGVYKSLLSLLRTARPDPRPVHRWRDLAPSMAVQILRSAKVPQRIGHTAGFESRLVEALTDVSSQTFQEVETLVQDRLWTTLQKRVKEFKKLSGVGLFVAATGGEIHIPGRGRAPDRSKIQSRIRLPNGADAANDSPIEDMATRLAHMGILHWRVWGPLIYEDDSTSP
ncbi:hypothetical protein VTK73DRAFT_1134 [Phialemonium thermophilum]|uniref:Uncharacterized protein n=1 Tax=Phialemonium thermophilum TaxID=223376 RepID=A0ABR3XBL8_9PEZI